jgi:hypothetical protein
MRHGIEVYKVTNGTRTLTMRIRTRADLGTVYTRSARMLCGDITLDTRITKVADAASAPRVNCAQPGRI